MGAVVPFPRWRNRPFVHKHACQVANQRQDVGERYLERQLDIQCEKMNERGIDPVTITVHRKTLDTAIRAELWRIVLVPEESA